MPIQDDYRRYNPLRTPDWRWQCASATMAAGRCSRLWEDYGIHLACHFLRALAAATTPTKRQNLARRMPDLSVAYRLFQTTGLVRAELEARLLADQPVENITSAMGVPSGVIPVYAEMFFDVPAVGTGNDWIASCVLHLDDWAWREPDEPEIWRWAAWLCGPLVLEALIGDHRGPSRGTVDEGCEVAASVRLMAREFAQGLRSPVPTPEILAEMERRVAARSRDKPGSSEVAVLQQQVTLLRMLVEKTASPRVKQKKPATGIATPVGKETCEAFH